MKFCRTGRNFLNPSVHLSIHPSVYHRMDAKPVWLAHTPGWPALRPSWRALRSGWLALGPGLYALRPSQLALRLSWLARRPVWLALEGTDVHVYIRTYRQTDGRTDVGSFSPFYFISHLDFTLILDFSLTLRHCVDILYTL